LAALERDLGPYATASQLQQRPVPREGAVFSAEWFRPLPSTFDLPQPGRDTRSLRATLRTVQYWDLAYSERDLADYTAAVTVGVDSALNQYVTSVYRERIGEASLIERMADHIQATRPGVVGVEIGAYRQAFIHNLISQLSTVLARRGVASAVRGVAVDRDKVTRAQLPATRARAGLVYADRGAPWWPAFERELAAFPRDEHDDQIDALSGATALAIETQPPPATTETRRATYALGDTAAKPAGWDPLKPSLASLNVTRQTPRELEDLTNA
ncbi:MAG TPA: phage terminase large subunit, partial [Coriobacteriia bacterium]|nr:phage terminase large subunit [Coriobacteriia bacterium]